MKKIDKIENLNNEINSIVEQIKASNSIEEIETLDAKLQKLKTEKNHLEMDETEEVNKNMLNYLETTNSVRDFIEIQKNHRGDAKAIKQAWADKLSENGLTISDPENYLPRKLELDIQTVLTKQNSVFPIFKRTSIGAILVARELTSTDEAQVHIPGTTKKRQAATLKVSGVKPKMIYKAQSLDEQERLLQNKFDELYALIVQELAQRVIDKIVDLALVEGTATEGETGKPETENGFISILNETNTAKVKRIPGKADLVAAVEEAVDSVDAPGKKYLIVTKAQKRQILAEVRKKFPQTTFFNNNRDIAETFGVDEIVIYQGAKEILPIVIAQDSYHIDMMPLNRIEQFRFDTNENDILVETPATGRSVAFGGIAVVDLAK